MICDGAAKLDIRRLWCRTTSMLVIDGVRLPIVRTPCHLGGTRNWFLCPTCARRCVLLYGDGYVCRICANGRYASELASPRDRKLRKALKARKRLGQQAGGIVAPFPQEPKHMHWATYLRIRAAAEEQESGADWRDWESVPLAAPNHDRRPIGTLMLRVAPTSVGWSIPRSWERALALHASGRRREVPPQRQ